MTYSRIRLYHLLNGKQDNPLQISTTTFIDATTFNQHPAIVGVLNFSIAGDT